MSDPNACPHCGQPAGVLQQLVDAAPKLAAEVVRQVPGVGQYAAPLVEALVTVLARYALGGTPTPDQPLRRAAGPDLGAALDDVHATWEAQDRNGTGEASGGGG